MQDIPFQEKCCWCNYRFIPGQFRIVNLREGRTWCEECYATKKKDNNDI